MKNVIVTGIPRSGTTLTAALIDGLPGSVCLNEPEWQVGRRFPGSSDYARWLVGDFMSLRQRLLRGEPIKERRSKSGEAVTNYFASNGSGRMETLYDVVEFTRAGLSPDFLLAVKHNGPYLAILKPLIELGWFSHIIAIVRNPIEVIHSWRSLELPISRAEMPAAAPYWPRLSEIASSDDELLVKQVKLYDLMCKRIAHFQDKIKVLPYEQLTTNPQILTDYLGVNAKPPGSLIDKRGRTISDPEREVIMRALAMHGEFYKVFYPAL